MVTNFYQKELRTLAYIKKRYDHKPTLLFHVCCGPCSLYPLEMLCDVFDITVYYANSNLINIEEFNHRLGELKKILKDLKERREVDIKLIVPTYNHEEYMKDLRPYKDDKEGGRRCQLCYRKRMEESFNYAKEHDFEFFTTSLTSSRQKSAAVINTIGEDIAKDSTTTQFFDSDFKKKAWAEKGYAIARERGYYLQEFCGCEYSLRDTPKEPKN